MFVGGQDKEEYTVNTSSELELARLRVRKLVAAMGYFVWTMGAVVILFFLINVMAAGLNRVHFRKEKHETQVVPGDFVPNRLRISRSEFHGRQVNIDKDGWRSGKASGLMFDEWSEFDYNVFMLGGSAMYGWTVDDDQTIPYYFQQVANDHVQGLPKVTAFNLASIGYKTREEVSILLDQIREGRLPEMVIMYDGANEKGTGPGGMFENISTQYIEADYSYWEVVDGYHRGERLLNPEFFPLLQLAARVRNFIKANPATSVAEASPRPASLDESLRVHAKTATQNYLANIEVVSKLAAAYKFKVVFFLQPLADCLPDPASVHYPFAEEVPAWHVAYYRNLYSEIEKQVKGKPSLQVVNLCADLDAIVGRNGAQFNTMIHLNSQGNKGVASIMWNLVRDEVRGR